MYLKQILKFWNCLLNDLINLQNIRLIHFCSYSRCLMKNSSIIVLQNSRMLAGPFKVDEENTNHQTDINILSLSDHVLTRQHNMKEEFIYFCHFQSIHRGVMIPCRWVVTRAHHATRVWVVCSHTWTTDLTIQPLRVNISSTFNLNLHFLKKKMIKTFKTQITILSRNYVWNNSLCWFVYYDFSILRMFVLGFITYISELFCFLPWDCIGIFVHWPYILLAILNYTLRLPIIQNIFNLYYSPL